MSLARITPIIGSLYALMRNRLGLNVATQLGAQELSCTVAPDRRLVVLGHEPIAGFARDHGTVADEAAMLALHTLDSTTLLAEPRFVAPGDSCLRADDPGWRWHCIANHGQALSDWERRPLGKNALGIQRADIGDASKIGRALMALATPSAPKIPQLNADGTVTAIDSPSWSESVGPTGVVNFSASNPSGATLAGTVTPLGSGFRVEWEWTYVDPWVFWILRVGTTAGDSDLHLESGTQTSNTSGSFTVTAETGYLQAIVQHVTNGSDLTVVEATCTSGVSLPTGATGWLSDGAGHFVPYWES